MATDNQSMIRADEPASAAPDWEQVATPPRKPLTRLAVAAARHWKITLAVWVALLAGGIYAYTSGLDREGFPAVSTPIVRVTAPYFADDAEAVDAEVAAPLSAAVAEVDGVVGVRSTARANVATLIVEFESDYSSLDGMAALEGIDDGVVPAGVEVVYSEVDAAAFLSEYDLLVSVMGQPGADVGALDAEADRVADYLLDDPNIVVADALNQLAETEDVTTGETVVRQTRFSRAYRQGEPGFLPAVTIGLDRADNGQDALAFSDNVVAALEAAPLSDGYEARVTADYATNIRTQLSELASNLLTGLIAVVLVSVLLISWRTAAVTAVFMVTVMGTSLLLLWLLGQSLNTITLFALILTLGLLVDDAIVIAEALDANRDEGISPTDVVRIAIDRVGTASLSGTLTTVLVFAPLLLVSGILGEFIRVLPVTVIVTLLASFVLSIILIAGLSRLFLLQGGRPMTPIIRFEAWLADKLASGVSLVERNRPAGFALGAAAIGLSIAVVISGFQIAGTLSFDIFPPSKDANELLVSAELAPGTTIEEAQTSADKLDAAIEEVLGDDMVAAVYFGGGVRAMFVHVDLVGFADRDTTASEYAAEIELALADETDMRVAADQLDQGPPTEEFPFAVQIDADADPLAAQAFASVVAETIEGTTITLDNGESVTVLETIVSTEGEVARTNGERYVEVRARFDSEDTSAVVLATQDDVEERWGSDELADQGLPADALDFDFGFESDNQNDFATTAVAFQFALVGILVLMVVQFRSLLQALLIMLAIPFGLFGVFSSLQWSDNPISFFVLIGLTGLIGVVVNNTILLTDAANQACREGMTTPSAMAWALRRRFRPLVATTLTTVVGLAPLALSDPFWEPMAYTIMFGLISSTALVVISFPFYYLAITPIGRKAISMVRGRRSTA